MSPPLFAELVSVVELPEDDPELVSEVRRFIVGLSGSSADELPDPAEPAVEPGRRTARTTPASLYRIPALIRKMWLRIRRRARNHRQRLRRPQRSTLPRHHRRLVAPIPKPPIVIRRSSRRISRRNMPRIRHIQKALRQYPSPAARTHCPSSSANGTGRAMYTPASCSSPSINTVTGINRLAPGLARSPVHSYTPTARTTFSGLATL